MFKFIILVTFILLSVQTFYSQEVGNVYDLNSYKYVLIKEPKYTYTTQDTKEILRIVRNLFLKKKIKTFTEDVNYDKLPDDFKTDSCLILTCGIEYNTKKTDLSDWGRITLKNCHEEIIYENTGKSIWSIEGAFENAFEPIEKMNYEYDSNRRIK